MEGLSDRLEFRFSVSMTTRSRRPGEADGVDYRFMSEGAFRDALTRGELVEWAEYGGNLYGTPRAPLEAALADGADLLLDIEMLGARQIKEAFPSALLVFIAPPSMEELERRLRSRGDTSEDDIARRLAVAGEQIDEAAELFDHIVVNDGLSTAIDRVADILAVSPQPRDLS